MKRSFEHFLKYKYSSYVARIEKMAKSLGARAIRNDSSLLMRPFIALATLIGVPIDKNLVRVIWSYLRFCRQFSLKSNPKSLVIYLKVCSVVLQKRLGGDYIQDMTPLGCRVSHSKGIPRIIPGVHRLKIREGNLKIIRLWLTLFALYRILEVKPKISLKTITSPLSRSFQLDVSFYEVFWGYLKNMIKPFPVLDLKWSPFSLFRSSPCVEPIISGHTWNKKKGMWKEQFARFSTSFPSIIRAALTWFNNPELKAYFDEWNKEIGILRPWRGMDIQLQVESRQSKVKGWVGPLIWTIPEQIRLLSSSKRIGKLGFKLEAAGKLRVFAMVDPFTQWIFKPLHAYIFSVIKQIPQDGTFDQLSPIGKLGTPRGLFSFDLSAATDRLSIDIQEQLLIPLIGKSLAALWRKILVSRPYEYTSLNWVKGRLVKAQVLQKTLFGDWPVPIIKSVYYATGQPMGALSSWAMLALTHHFLIQYSAWKSGVSSWFSNYAVLGDDVVIADQRVALFYRRLCRQIGLGISLPKSITSRKGLALEFAKQTFYRGHNVSPLTLKGFLMAKNNVASLVDFVDPELVGPKTFLKAYGFGYKVLSRVNDNFSTMRAHARFRDRLFTYLLMRDLRADGSVNQAMGRKSLKFIDRALVRGFQMGQFLTEYPIYYQKTAPILSLGELWDKCLVCESSIRDIITNVESDMAVGIGMLRDPKDRKRSSGYYEPFYSKLSTWYYRPHPDLGRLKKDYLIHLAKPFLLELVSSLDRLERIRDRIDRLKERLVSENKNARGADFFKEHMEVSRDIASIALHPMGVKRDPMLNSEWSKMIHYFHLIQGSKRPR